MMIVLCCLCLLALLIYLFLIMPTPNTMAKCKAFAPYLYAHRGYHDNATDAPENSMKAFALAVEQGYGMELDIQLSKDGQVVVFHDDTLERVCGVPGKVGDYTYAELCQFPLLQSDATIPLFSEVLALVDGKTPLIVEFKTTTLNLPLCEAGSKMLLEYDGLYCIESFYPGVVQWYKEHHPEVIRGQLSCHVPQGKLQYKTMEYLLTNLLTRPHFIAYDHNNKKNLSRTLCRYLFKNCAVAWTITSQQEFDACKDDFDLYIFEGFAPKG